MSKFHIFPSCLKGAITVPPSKSHTMRAILFGLLGKGKTTITHPLSSPDVEAMIKAIQLLGARVEEKNSQIIIKSESLQPAQDVIHAGNSGLILRLVAAVAALLPTYTVITGDHSIRHKRPVKQLLCALEQLGGHAKSTRLNDYAPILIKGPIKPGHAELSGEDSQPVSGLLIATSFLPGPSTLTVRNPGEKPWIDLTLTWLQKIGVEITHDNYTHYKIPGHASFKSLEVSIPGDFSTAAFPIVAALITHSELTLQNMDMQDCQGDKKIIPALQKMGANITIDDEKKTLTVKLSRLYGCTLDVNDFIDALPILSVVGCFAEGITTITGAAIAREKESNRIDAIITELKKMGATIEETPDGLIISHSPLQGATLDSHHDHRIAMALCVAALGARGESVIEGVECISKTYPTFATEFRTIGANIEHLP